MQIHDDHLYHGAALIQVAESPKFTAINSLKVGKDVARNAYKINDEIALYFKYCVKPTPALKEYTFTFSTAHLAELAKISAANPKTFIALVCVQDRQICCLTYADLMDLVNRRQEDAGGAETQYVILVTAPPGKGLRVAINAAGRRKVIIGKPLIVSRNSFPDMLFG